MYIKRKRCQSYRLDLEGDMQALVLHLEADMDRLRNLLQNTPKSAYGHGARQICEQELVKVAQQRAACLAGCFLQVTSLQRNRKCVRYRWRRGGSRGARG